jgi:hypothetical protein
MVLVEDITELIVVVTWAFMQVVAVVVDISEVLAVVV